MEKISAITKGVSACEISVLINNTALVKSTNGKSGLLNVKTNKLIGEMDNYYTIYDNDKMLYVQRRTLESITDNKSSSCYLRIYDAKEEKMIVDNFKLDKSFDQYYHFCSLRSPVNGKKYIFDSSNFRNKDMFAKGYDDVEKLCETFPNTYLVVTFDGKKGIYSDSEGLITEIVYDDIEYKNGVIIFTKGNKFGFVNVNKYKDAEVVYDEIEVDDKFVYAKRDGVISVYGLYGKNLLYTSRCDRLEYIAKDDGCSSIPQYFFIEKVGDKYGLVRTTINYNSSRVRDNPVVENSILLGPFYDEIMYNRRDGKFYIRQNGKYGLVESSYPGMVFTPAKYDKIVMLYDGFYALYTGNTCDIARVSKTPIVRACEIVDTQGVAIIFKKDNKYGILFSKIRREYRDHDIVLDGYDNIKNLGYGYYELEKDGKKGVCYRGLIIIPLKYNYIDFHYHKDKGLDEYVCFSLSNNENYYKLASKRHFNYEDSEVKYHERVVPIYYKEIKFLPDVMFLRNLAGLIIYNYKGETLKTFPANTNVSMLITDPGYYSQKVLYHIGDEYYFYKDGKFEQALMEKSELYVTSYESDYGIVVVNSYDEQDHKRKCERIEKDGEALFDKKLISYYEEHPEVYEKYPSLVKRKTK